MTERVLARIRRYDKILGTTDPAEGEPDGTAYAEFQKRYQFDCAGFARECIAWAPGEGLTDYQIEIMEALIKYRRVCVRGPHGLGKCLEYTSPMRLSDGRIVLAKDLIGQEFEVLAVDRDLCVHKAKAHAWDNGVREIVRITTDKGRVIERTLNHPLWADLTPRRWAKPESSLRLRPEGGWVNAGNLKPGAVVTVCLGNSVETPYPIPDQSIKITAYLIGNGGLTNATPKFSTANPAHVAEMAECADTFECSAKPEGKYDYRLSKKVKSGKANRLTAFLRDCELMGHDSFTKKFPDWVWQLDNRQLALFLSRLYGTDGWAHTGVLKDGRVNRQIGYNTTSPKLAEDVSRALLRMGVVSKVHTRKTGWMSKGVRKTSTAIDVMVSDADNILTFADNIGIYGKEDAVNKVVQSCRDASPKEQQKWRRNSLPDNMRWETVKSVEMIGERPTVGITVPGYETFLTDFVEHNSALAAIIILWYALTRDGKDWKIATTASVYHQLTHFLWPEIHKWMYRVRWDKVGRGPLRENSEITKLSITLESGAAFAMSPGKNSQDTGKTAGIEGAHADHLMYVFDESKVVPDAAFDSAEGAFSTDTEAYAVAISTPGDPYGRFFDIQMKKPGYSDWWVRHVTKDECIAAGQMSPAWAAQRAEQWGADSGTYINRVLGNFAEAAESVGVIPRVWVKLARARWRAMMESNEARTIAQNGTEGYGVDIGSSPNKTVLAARYPLGIYSLETLPATIDLMVLAERIAQITRPRNRWARVDSVGLGAGVYDRLRHMGVRVEAFDARNSVVGKRDRTGELQFSAMRSYAYWALRDLLNPAYGHPIALPDDDELEDELCAHTYHIRATGKYQISDKEIVERKVGRSPDKADSVVIAMLAAPSQVKSIPGRLPSRGI